MSLINSARTRPARQLAIAIFTIAITACTTLPRPNAGPDLSTPQGIEEHAQRLLVEKRFADAAAQYAYLARLSTDPTLAEHYNLLEAEILFTHQLEKKGSKRATRLPTKMLNMEHQRRRQLLQSALELYLQQPNKALLSLPDPALITDKNLLTRYHHLRFQVGAALEENTPMLDSLIALDALEEGKHREIRNNQIWRLLNTFDDLSIEQLNINASTPTHTGWLALLDTLRTVRDQGIDYRSSVVTWQQKFFDHPASQMLEAYDNGTPNLTASATLGEVSLIGTDAIALLLPFNDRLAKFSNAIRDGLLSAMYESQTNRELRIYDVGNDPAGTLPAYQQAVSDGAQLIIGPLRRDSLKMLVQYGDLSIPVIALNYLPHGGTDNLIQFSLSPEDEARSAADYMIQAGLKTAAMLLPDTSAGTRSGEAFKQRLERWGGEVVAAEVLDSTRKDYRKELSSLLHINTSLQRRRNIQSTLDTSLVFETRTRTDLDAIFAPVSSKTGRVLKPQLNFHGARGIPLLASSLIYGGTPSPNQDHDLEGVLFNDIPWLIGPRLHSESSLHRTANKLSLNKGPLSRFFALGVDAYRVTEQLGTMLDNSEHIVQGATGRLHLNNERRIRRQLVWAEFQSGTPKTIPFDYLPTTPPPPTDSLINPLLGIELPHATDP